MSQKALFATSLSYIAAKITISIYVDVYKRQVIEKDGATFLQTRYGDFPIHVPDSYFLTNLNAARLACRQLGVKDADFYRAISEYSVSLQP